MRKLRKKYGFKPTAEINNDPDMCIPGESYSLSELVKKHAIGQLPPVERQQIWQENASHDDLDLMRVHHADPVVKQKISKQSKSKLKTMQQQLESSQREGNLETTPEGSAADQVVGSKASDQDNSITAATEPL